MSRGSELVRAGFETLIEAEYDSRVPPFDCLHELDLIVDLREGSQGMRDSISKTTEYGDMTRGNRVITDETSAAMRQLLADIQSGEFAKEWIAENRAGAESFQPNARRGCRPPVRARRHRAVTGRPRRLRSTVPSHTCSARR